MTAKPRPAQRTRAYSVLHANGWLDTEIAGAFGLSPQAIRKWRIAEMLPVNRQGNSIDPEGAIEMYRNGANDREIAVAMGVDPSAVCKWRTRLSIPANVEVRRLSDETKRLARKMLRQGASRNVVAREVGCCKSTVQALRSSMPKSGLRGAGVSDRAIRRQVRNDSSLLPRIQRAIGANIPKHIRDEAVADMYAAVFEGRIARDQIERRAASFRSRAYDMCGSAYGPISLDAENESGLRLIDSIADPTAEDAMFDWYNHDE